MPNDAYAYYKENGVDVQGLIDLTDDGTHYTAAVLNSIQDKGIRFFRKLDVWDDEFLRKKNIQDPRRGIDKIMHWYLRKTQKLSEKTIIRYLDRIQKIFY